MSSSCVFTVGSSFQGFIHDATQTRQFSARWVIAPCHAGNLALRIKRQPRCGSPYHHRNTANYTKTPHLDSSAAFSKTGLKRHSSLRCPPSSSFSIFFRSANTQSASRSTNLIPRILCLWPESSSNFLMRPESPGEMQIVFNGVSLNAP